MTGERATPGHLPPTKESVQHVKDYPPINYQVDAIDMGRDPDPPPSSDLPPRLPRPARVLVMATVDIPGDKAMPLAALEAYVAEALRNGGVRPVHVNAEFIEAVNV